MGAEGVAVLVGVDEGVAVGEGVAVNRGVEVGTVAVGVAEGIGLETGPVTLARGWQAIGKTAEIINTAKINFFIKPSPHAVL